MHIRYLFLQDQWLPEDQVLLNYISPGRREKVLRYRFDKDRRLSLYASLLARQMLVDLARVPRDHLQFHISDRGKPELADPHFNTSIFFNISHTNNCLLCGLSLGQEIGVDVEQVRQAPWSVMARCFHPAEIAYVETMDSWNQAAFISSSIKESSAGNSQMQAGYEPAKASDRRFFEVWTRKEALLKRKGTGLTDGLTSINTLDPETGFIDSFYISNYIISISTSGPEAEDISSVSESDLRNYFLGADRRQ